ncbi:MAG: multidrug transporter [Alphaproteobacteria bacterium]|nr:MAG: multidrug transporter [Alphaproteobacteria bacterium]
MSKHELLNNIDHKDLRIITDRSAALGDNVMQAVVFPFEFRAVQAHYPILFFREGGSGKFYSVALFGFERGENLFLYPDGWDAGYVPLSIERQPFLIGMDRSGGETTQVVHIDMDSPRISKTEGVPVFLEQGGQTPYLERIAAILDGIHEGDRQNNAFIEALLAHGLLESLALDIQLNDGSQRRLAGFHAINEEKLAALDGAALGRLKEQGFLMPIYMALASLSQMNGLIARKNARLGGQ